MKSFPPFLVSPLCMLIGIGLGQYLSDKWLSGIVILLVSISCGLFGRWIDQRINNPS